MSVFKSPLKSNEIHIWQADLNVSTTLLELFKSFLSSDEREKAGRFVKTIFSNRYIASHGILREILSRYYQVDPPMITFTYSAHGKPYVDLPYQDRQLQFNMTHSRDYALYAVTLDSEIGIDIEEIRDIRAMDIAKRFFSEREYQQLLSLPDDEQLRGFFRCWTLKEAYLKATGEGLSFPLNKFTVNLKGQEDSAHALISREQDPSVKAQWSVYELKRLAANYEASIAHEGIKDKIIYLTWNKI